MKYLLYIFDVDGTLIDSRDANRATFGKVFSDLGLPPTYVDRAISLTGMEITEIFEALGIGNSHKVADVYRSTYNEYAHLEKPYPGIPSLLKKLKGEVLLAAATNRGKWDGSDLQRHFDLLMGTEDSSRKPGVEMFQKIKDHFAAQGKKLETKDCLMIGDSPLDIEFARNCGIDSAFVGWGFFSEMDIVLTPTYTVKSAQELYLINQLPVRVEVMEEIDLHTYRPDETKDLVLDYLAEAVKKGFKSVRIIHGKGKGTQREIVRSVLEENPLVLDFYDAPAHSGGLGATIAELKEESE